MKACCLFEDAEIAAEKPRAWDSAKRECCTNLPLLHPLRDGIIQSCIFYDIVLSTEVVSTEDKNRSRKGCGLVVNEVMASYTH